MHFGMLTKTEPTQFVILSCGLALSPHHTDSLNIQHFLLPTKIYWRFRFLLYLLSALARVVALWILNINYLLT